MNKHCAFDWNYKKLCNIGNKFYRQGHNPRDLNRLVNGYL